MKILWFFFLVDAGPLACTSCQAHFMLDSGLCRECLSSQYYDSPTQTCKTCHESCRSCVGPGPYSCQTCAFPLHLNRQDKQCVPCCPPDATHDENQQCCHCDKDSGKFEFDFYIIFKSFMIFNFLYLQYNFKFLNCQAV